MPVLLSELTDAVPALVLSAIGMDAPLDRFDTVIQGWNSYAVALAEGIERPYVHLREYVATRTQGRPGGRDLHRRRPGDRA